MSSFDLFISYNWDSKDKVRDLAAKLKQEHNYKVWIDCNELDSRVLYEQLVDGIKKSKVVICFITKKYAESENCKREITFASDIKKPLIVVMLEKCMIDDLGSVGFIIAPLTRFNFYHDKNLFNDWCGPIFESFLKSLENYVSPEKKSTEQEIEKIPVKSKEKIIDSMNLEEKIEKSKELNYEASIDKMNVNYASALDKLDQAIRLNPKEISFYINKAEILNQMKNYQESLNSLDIALRLEPNRKDLKQRKAFVLNELANLDFENKKNLKSSLKLYKQAIDLWPENKIFHINQSSAFMSLKNYEKALICLDNALALDPKCQNAIKTKAYIYNELGLEDFNQENYLNALEKYNQAIKLDAKEPIFYCNKADCFFKLKLYQEALVTLDFALKLNSNFEHAKSKKSLCLYYLAINENNSGNFNEALKKFNQAIELNSKEKIFYFNKSGCLNNLNKFDQAIEAINEALNLDPEYKPAILRKAQCLNSKAIVLNQAEMYKEALQVYEEALSLDPNDKVLYFNKAATLNNLKMYQEAIRMLDMALKLDPNYKAAKEIKAFSLNALGNLSFNSQNYTDAILKYNKALELNPEDKTYFSNKASCLISMKNYAKAIECLDIAIGLDPKYSIAIEKKAFALNSLGVSEDKLGNYENALKMYNKAIELNKMQKVFYANKADTLYVLKRYEEAVREADIALKLDSNYSRALEIKALAKKKINKIRNNF